MASQQDAEVRHSLSVQCACVLRRSKQDPSRTVFVFPRIDVNTSSSPGPLPFSAALVAIVPLINRVHFEQNNDFAKNFHRLDLVFVKRTLRQPTHIHTEQHCVCVQPYPVWEARLVTTYLLNSLSPTRNDVNMTSPFSPITSLPVY